MNDEIRYYIIRKCAELQLQPVYELTPNYLCFQNEYMRIEVRAGSLDGLYIFELHNLEIHPEVVCLFPVPETLRGFMQVCNVLKIFHI